MSSTIKNQQKSRKKELKKKFQYEEPNNASNNPPPELTTSSSSLIRFETPFLVSATVSNKKLLAELDGNNETSEMFLKDIINKYSISSTDYSLKDTLNKILPPKKVKIGDQMWVQYVSCNPVTKAEVINLYDGLMLNLKNEKTHDSGLCPIKEKLYDETFQELIRQITINCLERGILLMRVKNESDLTINTYKILYESCLAYGIRMFLTTEKTKKNYSDRISKLEDECEELNKNIEEMETKLKEKMEEDEKEHNRIVEEHDDFVKDYRRKINFLKSDIKDRLSFHN
jgi:dynein light intermediate chain